MLIASEGKSSCYSEGSDGGIIPGANPGDAISADGTGFVSSSDSFHPEFNKAPTDFDRTYVLNVAADYRIPVGRYLHRDSEMPKWVDALYYPLSGW